MTEIAVPQEGEIVWTDFDPATGHEQGGRRPALVMSPQDFGILTGFAIVCPITKRIRPFGTSVVLPDDFPIRGEILTAQVRSIDLHARPIRPSGHHVPRHVLLDVRAKLAVITGIRA